MPGPADLNIAALLSDLDEAIASKERAESKCIVLEQDLAIERTSGDRINEVNDMLRPLCAALRAEVARIKTAASAVVDRWLALDEVDDALGLRIQELDDAMNVRTK